MAGCVDALHRDVVLVEHRAEGSSGLAFEIAGPQRPRDRSAAAECAARDELAHRGRRDVVHELFGGGGELLGEHAHVLDRSDSVKLS
jgi:hypothetical protein